MKSCLFVIRLFMCVGLVLYIPAVSLAAHFLEPIGTEIPKIAPEGRVFLQSGLILSQSDAAGGRQLDSVKAPLVVEIGVGPNTQINFEADILFKAEAVVDRNLVNRDGSDELAFGLRHRFREESAHGDEMAFEIELAPSVVRNGANEFKFLFVWGGHVFGGNHLFVFA